MTNSTQRLGITALTTHEDHLVSMGCSYVLRVEHRDLRIAAAKLASSLGTASATTTSIGVLDDLFIEVISIWYRGLSDVIGYPIKRDDEGPVEATVADLSGSIRCDRRPDGASDEGPVVAISTSSSGCFRRRSKDQLTPHRREATSVCVSLRCESYSRESRPSPAPALD